MFTSLMLADSAVLQAFLSDAYVTVFSDASRRVDLEHCRSHGYAASMLK